MTLRSYCFGPLAAAVLALPASAHAQTPLIPIHGFNATLALPESVDKFYSDVNTVLVKTSDGIEHLVHVSNSGRPEAGSASVAGLRAGETVVVHYLVKGIQASPDEGATAPEGTKLNEGTVAKVDRSSKHVVVRFADGSTDRLRLSPKNGSRVVLYSADPAARGVLYYFKLDED